MSGLAGIFYLDGRPVDGQALHAMTEVVSHRGPDGIGHWVQGSVGLGHLQLCTTPESLRERQPLVSPDGNYIIVWDGRVDNREELVQELRHLAPVTSNATDVELVLHSYIVWGTACAKRIVGDFAFAIWDGLLQQLFCARDPIGIRLFHYHFDGRRFIFGTEIKEILNGDDVPRRLNEVMLGLYLCGNFGDGKMTFYQDIQRLLGGYSLVVSKEGLKTYPFWDPDPSDVIQYPKEADYAERFRELLLEAVRCRLRSSTGVETMLSGGLDSGSVASVAGYLRNNNMAGDARQSGITFVYPDPPLDETPFVRMVADQYDISMTWLDVDGLWAMKSATTDGTWDEPFNLHFEAMHCAALESIQERGIRVILTGEGGDETSMPGYMLHIQDWLRQLKWWALWRDLRGGTAAYRRSGLGALGRSLVPQGVRQVTGRKDVNIPPWVRSEFAGRCNLASWLRELRPHSRRNSLYQQQRGRNLLFLGGEQRCAKFGIEWRHPFYDARIVEFLARIPPGIRFHGGRSKMLLRRAMAGIVPEQVRRRAPHGAFQGLLERGLREMEASRLLGLLEPSKLEEQCILDPSALKQAYEGYLQGDDTKQAKTLWGFLAEEWLRQAWLSERSAEAESVKAI